MKELPLASPSAVAVLETPTRFLTEGRPDMPGRLAYSGRIQFFGGHIDLGPDDKPKETPLEAVERELLEELNLTTATPHRLWSGIVTSRLRDGTPALRRVNVFHVPLHDDVKLRMNVPGSIVSIPKTEAAVTAHRDRMTSFAQYVLMRLLSGEHVWDI